MNQPPMVHSHVFLAADHGRSERRMWAVIALCTLMMVAEIGGGLLFGSIALVADGLHMSTHASALLLAALAYGYARRHAEDDRFTFGTGKLGDLAGFTSAVILAMIALLVAYESIGRLFAPVPIDFAEAIPIAALGLAVNLASALLLSGGGPHPHRHAPGHSSHPGHDDHEHDDPLQASTPGETGAAGHQEEHHHAGAAAHRDNNLRAALVHVVADALVSVLVIAGLLLARGLGWRWIDPAIGIVGAGVIANWSFGLLRDTGAVLLDMNPDRQMARSLRRLVEEEGDRLADLHLWRLGPGHLGAIVSIVTTHGRQADYYRARLARFTALSHLTIEVQEG